MCNYNIDLCVVFFLFSRSSGNLRESRRELQRQSQIKKVSSTNPAGYHRPPPSQNESSTTSNYAISLNAERLSTRDGGGGQRIQHRLQHSVTSDRQGTEVKPTKT